MSTEPSLICHCGIGYQQPGIRPSTSSLVSTTSPSSRPTNRFRTNPRDGGVCTSRTRALTADVVDRSNSSNANVSGPGTATKLSLRQPASTAWAARECRHIHRHSRESGNPKAIGSKCVFASYRIPGSRFRGDDGNRRLETDILKLTTLPSITTTLPQFSQFMAGNRLTEGKATKLSIAWAGRHEEVLKVLFFRTVVVILESWPETGVVLAKGYTLGTQG